MFKEILEFDKIFSIPFFVNLSHFENKKYIILNVFHSICV